jgi:hypothetical protein
MDHILVRTKGAKMEEIKSVLKADAADHAKHGLVLRHIWRNADEPDEIAFIFTAADLDQARRFIEKGHGQMLKENPNANLPQLLFLKGE